MIQPSKGTYQHGQCTCREQWSGCLPGYGKSSGKVPLMPANYIPFPVLTLLPGNSALCQISSHRFLQKYVQEIYDIGREVLTGAVWCVTTEALSAADASDPSHRLGAMAEVASHDRQDRYDPPQCQYVAHQFPYEPCDTLEQGHKSDRWLYFMHESDVWHFSADLMLF